MGLDIFNRDAEGADIDLTETINNFAKEESKEMLLDLLEKDSYDALRAAIADVNNLKEAEPEDGQTLEEATQELHQDFIQYAEGDIMTLEQMSNLPEVPEDVKAMVQKYQWVFDESNSHLHNSRMGSYSTIHWGRQWADNVANFYVQRGEDVWTSEYVLTEEDINTLIALQLNSGGNTSYVGEVFNNLCNHADESGYYIPTLERVDFEYGSSILLLRELDRLDTIGAMSSLKVKTDAIIEQYPQISFAPEEVQDVYHTSATIYWVLSKMLYHAVDSVENEGIITFG